MTTTTAPKQIAQLVQQFEQDHAAYRLPSYNEAQVRSEFIDPFFEALGWDVGNRRGSAQAQREVIVEDRLRVGAGSRAPDYCFYLGNERKFFVEAKKPSVNLEQAPEPAFQVRRYGWSAKLPLSILTDFEEFVVYDCRPEPMAGDPAHVAQTLYLDYTRYVDEWDTISDLFSREAVLGGSLDKFAEAVRAPRGTATVDAAFLKEISQWREMLAVDIASRNPTLTQRQLNYAVQMTIDRIIFLRIAEDRGTEPYQRLESVTKGTAAAYPQLCTLFRDADDRYNSGLFHFKSEKGRDEHDDLTLSLNIGDEPLRRIVERLYQPYSPYAFDVIPVEILGQVYEQFLGKVISLTSTHEAVIEDKPEVRKAGGVYYTPTYIVEYIVRHTVGALLGAASQSKTQNPKSKILDPACGSGSFLIGAYQFLLDWHRDWYVKDGPQKHKKQLYEGAGGVWRLTLDERKRILLNNIYGVDIDSQAVEVTKLSLLLKVLEGEKQLAAQARFGHERALPDLSNNIKCGNSLIGYDFYEGQQMGLFGEEETYRINAFDWQREFPEIMKAGGFDAVIGNPPYVRSINLKESNPLLWDLYRSRYESASAREWDIYLIFVEKALALLKADGKLGFILPNKFLNSQVGENLRAILARGQHLNKLVHFGAFQVFQGATTYTCLLFLDKAGNEKASIARYIGSIDKLRACPLPEESPSLWSISDVLLAKLKGDAWNFAASGTSILEKLRQWPAFETVAQMFQGTGTRADKVYLLEDRGREGDLIRIFSPERAAEFLLEPTYLKPALRGRSIGRYEIRDCELLLLVPYEITDNKSRIVLQDKLADIAPRTLNYLRECKPRLDERENGRFKDRADWYAYGYPRSMARFDSLKVVMPDVCNRGKCWLEDKPYWLIDTAYGVVSTDGKVDLRYLLGILNSPLLTYFLKETGTALRGGYFRMKTAYLNPFPIRTINFTDPTDKAMHDRMVALVEQMLRLHKDLAAARTPTEKTSIQRQIEATDRLIDKLVYKLYGLSEEEIKIVEGVPGE